MDSVVADSVSIGLQAHSFKKYCPLGQVFLKQFLRAGLEMNKEISDDLISVYYLLYFIFLVIIKAGIKL